MSDTLPIEAALPAIHEALKDRGCAVLQAPPGAGKTTRLPLSLLEKAWLEGQRILLIEPRRLVVTSVAAYLARQLHEAVGARVGYRIRFETQVSQQTQLEVLTTGLYLRRLQQDPSLEGIGLVIFDEFHERSLELDLALALTLNARELLCENLRLLVMSATLEAAPVSNLLADDQGDAPLITVEGQSFPVEVTHYPRVPRHQLANGLLPLIHQALQETRGSVLVFLPGQGEIRQTERALQSRELPADVEVVPLYGDLDMQAQRRATQAPEAGKRRITLSTSLAETALTLPDIQAVVDGGWRREPRFDPGSGLTRLETVAVSKAAAEQRRGRAGRVCAGRCYRLYSENDLGTRSGQSTAEMASADLAPLLLQLAAWGTPVEDLRWLTTPPEAALSQARQLLQQLGALDDSGGITEAGQAMVTLPTHPRLAHLIVEAGRWRARSTACALAALLSERDLFRTARGDAAPREADLRLRLDCLQGGTDGTSEADWNRKIDRQALKRLRYVVRQFEGLCRNLPGLPDFSASSDLPETGEKPSADDLPGLLLAQAYPDRIAQARASGSPRYLLSNGRGARLDEQDSLVGRDYLVAVTLDGQARESRIFLAAPVSAPVLESALASQVLTRDNLSWSAADKAVVARRELRLGALVLRSQPLANPDSAQLALALCEGIRQQGLDCLPWTEALRHWQSRVVFLHRLQPGDCPDLSDPTLLATLEDWLPVWLAGMQRFSHLQRLDLGAALRSLLPGSILTQLDQLVPVRWKAPTGTGVTIHYPESGAPYSEVRLQEVFGQREGPRLAGGQPVLLHLLSPARRPVAVTDNLARFWEVGYPDVRKDMRGRYPKHPWPENPLEAEATRRAKPRKS